MTANRTPASSCRAAPARKAEAPAPTGSNTTGTPIALACRPAASMAGTRPACRVPRLRVSPRLREVISAASSGASAMMGEAPAASRMLAQSLAVT